MAMRPDNGGRLVRWLGFAVLLAQGCAPTLPPAERFLADQVVDMPTIALRSAQGAADDPMRDAKAQFVALTMEIPGLEDGAVRAVQLEPDVKPVSLGCPGPYCLKLPAGAAIQARVELWSATDTGTPAEPIARGRTLSFVAGDPASASRAQAYLVPVGAFSPAVASDGTQASLAGRVGIGAAVSTVSGGREAVLVGGALVRSEAVDPLQPGALISFSGTIAKYDAVQRKVEQSAQSLQQPRAFAAVASGASVVAIVGGYVQDGTSAKATATVEYLDKSGVLIASAHALKYARAAPTIVAMFGGQDFFLILGGHGNTDCSGPCAGNTWEIWHPQHGVVTTGSLLTPRWRHAAAQLPGPGGGYVMLLGGENDQSVVGSAEIVQWTATSKGVVHVSRAGAKCDDTKGDDCAAHANFFWAPQLVSLPSARTWPGGGLIRALDAKGAHKLYVAVFGGYSDLAHTKPHADLHVFDYQQGAFRPDPLSIGLARGAPIAASVAGGRYGEQLLAAGGTAATGEANSDAVAFLAQPDAIHTETLLPKTVVVTNPLLEGGRLLAAAVPLPTGHILLAGGVGGSPGAWVGRSKVLLWGAF